MKLDIVEVMIIAAIAFLLGATFGYHWCNISYKYNALKTVYTLSTAEEEIRELQTVIVDNGLWPAGRALPDKIIVRGVE